MQVLRLRSSKVRKCLTPFEEQAPHEIFDVSAVLESPRGDFH